MSITIEIYNQTKMDVYRIPNSDENILHCDYIRMDEAGKILIIERIVYDHGTYQIYGYEGELKFDSMEFKEL